MTSKDIERIERQLDELPGKLIEQIHPIISNQVSALELRITRELGERVTAVEQSSASAHRRINECVNTERDNGVHINLIDKDVAGLSAKIKGKPSTPAPTKQPRQVAIKFVIPVASIVGLITAIISILIK